MVHLPRILAFAGSTRADSFNKKLVRVAADGARDAGAEVTLFDLADLPLPLFDQDFESAQGVPENARKLKELFLAHDGLLIASPEYNSSLSAVLKNAVDWVSRPAAGEAPLACFQGKHAAIMSASPGALGGLRGLVVLRMLLGNIQVTVLPDQKAIPAAHQAFAPDGSLVDSRQADAVRALGARLATALARVRG